jgi:protein O-GlcNAc transferase
MEFCAINELSLDEIATLHKQWGSYTEEKREPMEVKISVGRGNKSKIRIGYCSPDLHEHSVGYLIQNIIQNHNHNEFEIYCYSNNGPDVRDAVTENIIRSVEMFKYVKHLSDYDLAREIAGDRIDVLIDLAGHTAGHRLRAMAYKPAPVQMTYLGYPNTTGMSRIDYRITDRYAEATEDKDYRYSEKLLRLTNCFLAFDGFGNIAPIKNRTIDKYDIVFGCFNNVQKLTPKVIELWAGYSIQSGKCQASDEGQTTEHRFYLGEHRCRVCTSTESVEIASNVSDIPLPGKSTCAFTTT